MPWFVTHETINIASNIGIESYDSEKKSQTFKRLAPCLRSCPHECFYFPYQILKKSYVYPRTNSNAEPAEYVCHIAANGLVLCSGRGFGFECVMAGGF